MQDHAEKVIEKATAVSDGDVQIAAVHFPKGQGVDAIFAAVADHMAARDVKIAGLVQIADPDAPVDCCPPMLVRDVSQDTSTFRISEDRGPQARGCRLDWDALSQVAMRTQIALDNGAQLLMINRFGKAESQGSGLRGTIEQAIGLGVPVLVGVRDEYASAWAAFHSGLATNLPPDSNAVIAWADTAVAAHK